MNELEYLSDAELLALIETTEQSPLLHAPRDVKQAVMTGARQTPAVKKPSRQKQFYSYCARVAMATAACLAILFIPTPAKGSAQTTHISLTQQLNRITDTLEQRFSEINSAFADFDFNFDFNFGGNRDE